ncbi:hypothetical protein N7490_005544 [Penicillium lividum]|nr:hypothetical protein N7490_005544 [Penicillium lividum]
MSNFDNCTLSTCPLSEAYLDYLPNLPANAFFVALFGLIAGIQLLLGIKYRIWTYMTPMLFGLILEVLGYIGRIMIHSNPFNFSSFLLYLVCLTIAPAFFSAAIYICLGKIIIIYGAMARFSPQTYTIFFVTCDVISLVLQAAGGAIASIATESQVSLQQTGVNVMIAGLAFQVFSLFLFIVLASDFALRVRKNPKSEVDEFVGLRQSWKWKIFIYCLALATLTIFIRSIFRVAELKGGFSSSLANNEVDLMVLEIIATSLAATAHATDWSHGGNHIENIGNGAGLPFALDSFNGLELQDDEDSIGLDLVRRSVAITSLANNNFVNPTIKIGETQYWYIPDDVVNGEHGTVGKGLPEYIDTNGDVVSNAAADELRKRGFTKRDSTKVYLSLSTCSRPDTNTTGAEGLFPQLKVYYSTSKDLKYPGPGKDDSLQNVTIASNGYIGIEFDAESDVYISVVAENTTSYSGSYTYELAISIDDYFFKVVPDDPFLYFVDSDQSAALLVTNNLTQSNSSSQNFQQWMNMTPPYTLFAHNLNDTSLKGLSSSFCAVQTHSQVTSNPSNTDMTSRGLGNRPKEQFYILGLNRSSTYVGILGMIGNSTNSGNNIIGGGGIVWQPMNFTTKTEDNCAVLFNLTFCSEVAYAVPSNPNRTVEDLRQIYDNYTSKYYQYFNYSLQQIQCNASADSMFSLTVNCTDCASQYKQWLCSVSIPAAQTLHPTKHTSESATLDRISSTAPHYQRTTPFAGPL